MCKQEVIPYQPDFSIKFFDRIKNQIFFIKMLLKSMFNLRFFFSILKRRSRQVPRQNNYQTQIKKSEKNNTLKDIQEFSLFHQQIRQYTDYQNFYQLLTKMNETQYQTNINLILQTMIENMFSLGGHHQTFIKTMNYVMSKNLKDNQFILIMKILTKCRKNLNVIRVTPNNQLRDYLNSQQLNIESKLRSKCRNNEIDQSGLISIINLAFSNIYINEAIYSLNQLIYSKGKDFELSSNNLCYLIKGYCHFDFKVIRKCKHINKLIMQSRVQSFQFYYGAMLFQFTAKLKLHLIYDQQKIPILFQDIKKLFITNKPQPSVLLSIMMAYRYLPLNFDNSILHQVIKMVQDIRLQHFLKILAVCPMERLSSSSRQKMMQRLKNMLHNLLTTSQILNQICGLQNIEDYYTQDIIQIIDQRAFSLLKKQITNPKIQLSHYIVILKLLTRKYFSVQKYLSLISDLIFKNIQQIDLININQFLLILQISRERNDYDVGNQKIELLELEIIAKIRQSKSNRKLSNQLIKICKNTQKAQFISIENIHIQILRFLKSVWAFIQKFQTSVYYDNILTLSTIKYPEKLFRDFTMKVILQFSREDFNTLIDYYICRQVKTYLLTDLLLDCIIQRNQLSLKEFLKLIIYSGNTLINEKGTINMKIPTIINSKYINNEIKVENVSLILLNKAAKICTEMDINLGPIKNLVLEIANKCQKLNIQEIFLISQTFFCMQWSFLSKSELINIATKIYNSLKSINFDHINNYNLKKLLRIYQKVSNILQNKNQIFAEVIVEEILSKVENNIDSEKFEVIWLLLELDLKNFIKLEEGKKKQLLLKLDTNKNINIINLSSFINFAKSLNNQNSSDLIIFDKIKKYLFPVIENLYIHSKEYKSTTILIEYYELALKYRSKQMISHIIDEINLYRFKPIEIIKLIEFSSKKRIFVNKIFQKTYETYYNSPNYFQNLEIKIIYFFCKSFYTIPNKYIQMINRLLKSMQHRIQILLKRHNIINYQQFQYYIGRFLNALWSMLLLDKTQLKLFRICSNIFTITIIQKLKSMHSEYLLGLVNDIYLMLKLKNIYMDSKFEEDMNQHRKYWQRNNTINLNQDIVNFLNLNKFIPSFVRNDVKVDYYNKQKNIIILFLHSYLINSTGDYESGFSKSRDILIAHQFQNAKIIKINLKTSFQNEIIPQITEKLKEFNCIQI